MKKTLRLLTILLFLSGCNSTEELDTTLRYESTKGFHTVEMNGENNKVIIFDEISDIGKGSITLPEGNVWPQEITLRLPFPRLEGFKAYTNLDKEHTFEHFHSTGRSQNQYISTYKGTEKKKIAKDDTYVEIELPSGLWKDNPKIIYIEWVNVYRN